MTEKVRPQDPDDKAKARPDARTVGAMPTRVPQVAADVTEPGPGAGSAGGDVDATISMQPSTQGLTAQQTAGASPPGGVIQAAAKPITPKEGQVIANRFVVNRLLGQGGMGRVYAVQDRQIEGRDVALKVLLPKYSKNAQFRKLFFQEVRAAQEFVSEYICQVRDTGETEDGSLFLTMDLVEGEALRALLDREKFLGARQALEITRQVLLGLHSGHEKGYVHRDIKPSNVMLAARVSKTDTNPYGVGVRLLDFGIAGLATEIDERSRAGTVMYMSPEQASGERLDPRSDLFAVGVLMFEMLSGTRPFEGTTTRALVQSVLETNLTARLGEIPNLSKAVRRLLERALQKDRNKRFQSATDFADEIAKSAAYRLPRNIPGWAYAGLAIFGTAAIGEAFLLNQHSGDLSRLRLMEEGIPGRIADARTEVTNQKAKELQSKQEEVQSKQIELQSKQDELAAKLVEFDKLNSDYRKASTDLEKAGTDITDLRRQLQASLQAKTDQAQNTEVQADLNRRLGILELEKRDANEKLARLQETTDQLSKENTELKFQLKPEGRKAETFDKVMAAIEAGRGDTALEQLAEAARMHAIFLNDGLDGVAFLKGLATTSAELRKHAQGMEKSGRPDMEAVSRALSAFDRSKEELATFPAQTEGWISFKLGDTPAPDRIAQARSASENLGKKLAGVRQGAEDAHSQAWTAIAADAAVKDPDAVFAHADRFLCTEHLSIAADRAVDAFRIELAPGGALDLDRLRKQTSLGKWVAQLDKTHFALDPAKEFDLRTFEFAQRWYIDPDISALPEWKFARPQVPTSANADWRQIMFLQWQLSQDSANFPIKKGRTQLYRTLESGKIRGWGKTTGRSDSRFAVETQAFDEKGYQKGTASPTEFELVDGTLRVRGSDVTIVDLHAHGEGLSVEPFPVIKEDLPVPSSLATDADVRKFRDYLKTHQLACLVVQAPGRTRWLSPEFGLVFDDNVGILRRELVSATGVQ